MSNFKFIPATGGHDVTSLAVTAVANQTTRRVGDKFSDVASLLDFGAAGDGTTDDVTAIQAAIDSSIVSIDGGGLTYRVDSTVLKTISSSGYQKRITNAIFDFSNAAASDRLFDLTGTKGSGVAPSANITAGTDTVSMTSTAAYAVGDWLLFESANSYATDGTTHGEWNQVRSKTATVLTMEREFHLSYTTTPQVFQPDLIEWIAFENVTIIGGGDGDAHRGINLAYAERADLINCVGRSFADRCFNVLSTVHTRVVNMVAVNADQSTGLAYGLVGGGSCESFVCVNPIGFNLRHVITLGSTTGVMYHPTVIGGSGSGLTAAGIDSHAGTMYANFDGGTWDLDNANAGSSEDGLVMQGAHCRAANQTIRGAPRHGVLMQPQTSVDDDTVTAENITVIEHGQDTSGSAGLQLGYDKTTGDVALVRLHGHVHSTQTNTQGWGIGTSRAQGNTDLIAVDVRAVVTGRGCNVAPSHAISIDRIDVRGSYEQQATATELLFFNSLATDDIDRVNINAESLIGGTRAIRNNNDRVTAINALALEVAGQSNPAILGANVSLKVPNAVDTVNGDTTPSVAGLEVLVVQATTSTISDLDDGSAGQTVKVIFDTAVTVDFTGTNLNGNAGADWSAASGDHMVCTTDDGTQWYCVVSDNT